MGAELERSVMWVPCVDAVDLRIVIMMISHVTLVTMENMRTMKIIFGIMNTT